MSLILLLRPNLPSLGKASRRPSDGAPRVRCFCSFEPRSAEFGCDCCVRLGELIFEGFVPAEGNQSRDDYNFSH